MRTSIFWLHALILAGVVVAGALASAAATRSFDLPADAAEQSLKRFSLQSGLQVVFAPELTDGVRTNPVKGDFTPMEAADRLLAGTALRFVRDDKTGLLSVARLSAREREAVKKKSPSAGAHRNANPLNPTTAAQTTATTPAKTMKRKTLFALLGAWIGLGTVASDTARAAEPEAATGVVAGFVRNVATGVNLEGARIEVAGSTTSVTTDRDGSYRLRLAPGRYTLTASYSGLETASADLVVASGGAHQRDFGLTADIYELGAFVVASEREGNALAIVQQRAAPNVKNVISADAFGSLAGNPADLLERVPGITAERVGGDIRFISIRGIDSDLNSVQVDGNRIASVSNSRGFQFQNIGSDHIESIEVTKAPTPDMDADAIGGSVNLRSRSGFDLANRRITYSLGVITASERDDLRPAFAFSYSDVFNVAGGERNLAISLSGGFRQHFAVSDRVIQTYQITDASPAFFHNVEYGDQNNIRTRYGGGLKVDYKLSADTVVSANFTLAPHRENARVRSMVSSTNQVIAPLNAQGQPTGTGGIMPGFTDQVTVVRPVAASRVTLNGTHNQRKAQAFAVRTGARTKKDTWELDYDLSYSYAANNPFVHTSSIFLTGAGWTASKEGVGDWTPNLDFTAGPDPYSISSYLNNQLTLNKQRTLNEILGSQINFQRRFNLEVPASLKMGLKFREEGLERYNRSQRWSLVGRDGAMGTADDRLDSFVDANYSYRPYGKVGSAPHLSMDALRSHKEANPGEWSEDVAYRVQQNLTGRQTLEEKVLAGYVMGSVRLSALSILGGFRVEQTDVEGVGSISTVTPEERARRAAWVGPLTPEEIIRRGEAEFGPRRRASSSYRNVFPGVHFKYEPFQGLLVRASYSTGIGRPAFNNILPLDLEDEENRVLRVNNTGLKPQYADNFDASVEYYFEPVGVVSAGVFLKELSSFIYNYTGVLIGTGPDNGFGGNYAGYELRSQANGGSARVRGFELNYAQQFTFLPGWWSGWGLHANYTYLETEGNYGDPSGASQDTATLPGFIPRAGNIGISYIRGRWNLRLHYAHAGDFLGAYNVQPSRRRYVANSDRVDFKAKFTLNRRVDFYLDLYNIFNDKFRDYWGQRPRFLQDRNDPQIHFGVNGRF